MSRETVGLTEVIEYDSWASYNGDASRTASSISFIQQDNGIVVGGKRYSQNAECYVGSDVSGISTTGNWFLCGETTMAVGTDVHIIASLQQTLEAISKVGLFAINLRYDGGTTNTYHSIQWLTKVGSSLPKLRLVVNGASVKLYCQVYGGQYRYAHIRFYNQVARTPNERKNIFFTLANSTTIISEADVPSGTDIADVPYLLKDGTAANSKRVNMSTTADNAERRVLFGHDYNANGVGDIFKSPDLTYNPSTKTLTVPQVNGNANSANKLATSRKIGFADFNGTASISLNAIQGANVTRWSASGTLKPNQWIRFIRMKFSQVYSSVSITLAIEEGEQHKFRGIINFTAWVGSSLTPSVNNSTAIWYSLYQVDRSGFGDATQYIRMIPVAPTDNDANGYVDVYVMSPLGSISYGWHVINDRQVNNASFTLKADATSIIDNENFPTSYKSSGFQGVLTTGENVEYGIWVTKATTATNADVANKTKYPIVFERNGASITNWFANTTFTIDIPEELLDYSSPTGITLKVPEIDVAKEAKKVANKLMLTVNGSTTEYDGSAGARVSIKANCTHIVKANSSDSLGTLYPGQTGHPSAVTVPVSILPLEPYNSAAGGLNDGDTLILHIPNSMSNPTANYVWCAKLDITKENATDNIIPLIHGQSAGTPAFWNTSTTITAGFYQFVYSATLGGLVYMYRNTATT